MDECLILYFNFNFVTCNYNYSLKLYFRKNVRYLFVYLNVIS